MRIADAVHGTIELNPLESELIETRSFQRLRGIKQLGLADFVFPGANYTRFAHGIGVCYVASRIVEALNSQSERDLGSQEMYRAAALLHDIGHYPFSHALEGALRDAYSDRFVRPEGDPDEGETAATMLDHEELGIQILETETDINEVLHRHGVDPKDLADIIGHRGGGPPLASIISSDLDADRLDYMLRTAKHTGLPYGHIDIDYILAMIRLDTADRLCLDARALRTAEHFLLARHFDYQQVVFHKAVVGFEEMLKRTVGSLVAENLLEADSTAMLRKISDPAKWVTFDEAHLWGLIRELASLKRDDPAGLSAQALLDRRGPKVLGSAEFFANRQTADLTSTDVLAQAKKASKVLESECGIPEEHIWVWSRSASLTKLGSRIPVSARASISEEDAAVMVRILDNDGSSRLVTEMNSSLLSVLADHSLAAVRIYALPPFPEPRGWRKKACDLVRREITSSYWTPATPK